MNISEESLTKLWEDYAAKNDLDLRYCNCCEIYKPATLFNGNDKTCLLCRKLLRLGFKYSSKLKRFNKSTILKHEDNRTICTTCMNYIDLDEMATCGTECQNCWLTRSFVELASFVPLDMFIKCLRCETSKHVAKFPIGRLTCRSCICDENANG